MPCLWHLFGNANIYLILSWIELEIPFVCPRYSVLVYSFRKLRSDYVFSYLILTVTTCIRTQRWPKQWFVIMNNESCFMSVLGCRWQVGWTFSELWNFGLLRHRFGFGLSWKNKDVQNYWNKFPLSCCRKRRSRQLSSSVSFSETSRYHGGKCCNTSYIMKYLKLLIWFEDYHNLIRIFQFQRALALSQQYRYKSSSTPVNTVIMFVPQQEVKF